MSENLSLALWNLQWAAPGTPRGRELAERLRQLGAGIICLTEAQAELLPEGGHTVTSQADYGYPVKEGRRKVLLWSRAPWEEIDALGAPELPPGRFVAATTESALGRVRVIGVCIPWKDAHVRTGQANRQPWEDHLTYLQHLGPLLQAQSSAGPAIVAGDFNQRFPRIGQPRHVYAALKAAIPPGFTVATRGPIAGSETRSIDHALLSPHLRCTGVQYLSPRNAAGGLLSDHFGLRVEVERNL